jgi:malonate transporter and related proteins
MGVLLPIVLPVFAMIFAGYLLGQKKILNIQASQALNGVVYYLAFPALLFGVVARTPPQQILNWPFLGAWLSSIAIVFVITALLHVWLWRGSRSLLAMRGLNTTCASTAFMGIPLCVAAFGNDAALPAVLATTLLAVFDLSAAIILLEMDKNSQAKSVHIVRNIVLSLLKNPLMLSVMAGAVVASTVGGIPVAVARFCELMGGAAIPCSLVGVGLFFSQESLTDNALEVGVLSAVKLILHPLVAYGLILTVFPMDIKLTAITVLLASLPPATTVFVIAQRYQMHTQQTSAVMLVTTLLSVMTTMLILGYFLP